MLEFLFSYSLAIWEINFGQVTCYFAIQKFICLFALIITSHCSSDFEIQDLYCNKASSDGKMPGIWTRSRLNSLPKTESINISSKFWRPQHQTSRLGERNSPTAALTGHVRSALLIEGKGAPSNLSLQDSPFIGMGE